ncbi:MerR family transcriptional regulator [Actinomadura fibrosa]|uniref:MerR family transcriptional regulator n=1 Tax=Actinomadura fibrosa TaxID=111802 RepID=A0ABW2XE67_9ACTN|nr:MerR family transcriptional regulator [Actinomadura fibrosa]
MDEDARRWPIGELARRTGLSVRALRYFEEIGLLRPSGRSDAGHRWYSASDVRRLYRIVALRELEMPLEKIGQALDGTGGLQDVVADHLAHVEARLAAYQRLRRRLAGLLDAAGTSATPSIDELIEVMEATVASGYFSDEQLTRMRGRHPAVEGWQERWAGLAGEVRRLIAADVDAADPAAQDVARRWSAFMDELTGGDRGVLSAMYAKLDGQGPEAATKGVIDTAVWEYIRRAFALAAWPTSP